MNSAGNKPIQILVLHDTQNDAEPLINHFRVNGYATRSQFIASEDELSAMLADHEWDLILAKLETETVNVPECLDAVIASGIDLPIIVLIEEYDISTILKGFQLGAKDVILDGEPDLLVPSALRELAALEMRRQFTVAKEQLAQSEKRVQLLLRNSKDAIAYVHDGMHIYANESYMEMFGYDDLDDLLCVPVIDIVAPEFQSDLKKLLKQKGTISEQELACRCVNENEEAFDVEMDFSSAVYDGEPCLQIIISKIEDSSAELQKQLEEISHKDLVTGLYNRQYFMQVLTARFKQITDDNSHRYLGYIHIADINDIRSAAGVSGTDAVLTAAAGIISGQLSEGTTIARIADDAFALIYDDMDRDAIENISKCVVDAAGDQLLELSGKTIQINCVVGVALLDSHSADGHEALLEAQKASGVALEEELKVSFFDRTDVSNIADGDQVAEIKFAIENNRFILYFQPIISLRGDDTEHYEVLLRIVNKDGEKVSIGPYVAAILLSGQAAAVDKWVIESAIKAIASHQKKHHKTRLFVHITYATISDPDFLPWVNALLKKHKVSGNTLVFQLSEQDASDYLKPAKAFSKGLNLLKCSLSIGNFGKVADVKTLARHLDIDFMKVDPSIVQGLETEEGHQYLKNLINDIRAEGLASIVPHIESASLMQKLWQDGANYVQGHLLQPPMETMDFNFSDEE